MTRQRIRQLFFSPHYQYTKVSRAVVRGLNETLLGCSHLSSDVGHTLLHS